MEIDNPVSCLKKIKSLSPPYSCEWCVLVTVLSLSANKSEAKNPDFYGYVIPLGSFKTEEKAKKNAKKIMKETGCMMVTVCKYGGFFPLSLKNENVEDIAFDKNGNFIEMETDYDKKIKKFFEEKKSLEEKYTEEFSKEQDESTPEYLKSQYYFMLNNAINISRMEKEIKEIRKQYDIRKNNIERHLESYPDNENKWWNLLEKDFENNLPMLDLLASKYNELK